MKTRDRLIRRGHRGDTFNCVDTATGKRTSLHAADPAESGRLVAAKNEAERQPMLNRHLARATSPDCCRRAAVKGVTPHCYRYSWAERAKVAGYPERFAQEALGHNSKAVHRPCAKRAIMKLPSLEDYEHAAAARPPAELP